MLAWIKKYWFYISIAFTILSSLATGAWWIHSQIDAVVDKVNDTNDWVESHDNDLKALHDDVVRLKEDERLRELFEFKRK